MSGLIADVDGHWLGLLRQRLGAIPIIGTIDPHANLSPAMVAATDALIAYRTNPHVDQRDRGIEAARLMARRLAGEIRPTQAAAFPPLVINIECQDPAAFPCLPHYENAARLRAAYENASAAGPVARGTMLSTSIVLGFPYADVPEMGSAAIVVTHDDPAAARRHADALGDGLLLDMGDNVGGGSPADGMAIARAILKRGIRESFVCVCDPEAAAWATDGLRNHARGTAARRHSIKGPQPPRASKPVAQARETACYVPKNCRQNGGASIELVVGPMAGHCLECAR